jgi:hypothetical protein
MYGKLTNQSATYVSGTFVTLDAGLNKRGLGGFEAGPGAHYALDRQRENLPPPLFVKEGSLADLASSHR